MSEAATIIALGDRIIAEFDPIGETAGGIIVPDAAKKNMPFFQATVISVGKAAAQQSDVKEGDRIIFPNGWGIRLEVAGRDLIFLKTTEALCLADKPVPLVYKERDRM